MKQLRINHVAVWVVAVITQFVPPIWYNTVFFGIRWMELNDFVEADFENYNMPVGLGVAFAACLVAAYALAWIFTKANVQSGLEGMKWAFVIWVGFNFLEITTQNMFSLRPFELTLMDETVVLVKYQIAGVILGLWRKYK